jgi:glucuronoarabinoxylan endo-1,4-beta-xylanase
MTAPRAHVLAVVALSLVAAACIRHGTAPPPPATAAEASAGVVDGVPAYPAVVTLVPGERHQTLEGFGAAVAWYQDKLVPNPPPGIYETIFPELGLDILRLRNRYQRKVKQEDNNIAQDAEIIRRATAALGHPPKILLSSWSPPAGLKANHAEDCHGENACTLVKENGQFVYDKFGAYWRDALVFYASQGIVPDWISIENEPSFIPPSWEGCKFDPTETERFPGYDRALAAVHAALATLPKRPKILGPEVLGIHHDLVADYLKPMNLDFVDGIAHHLYEMGPDKIWDWKDPGPDSYVAPMQSLAALAKKPLWQTEFSTIDDGGTLGGFEIASLIHHSLVTEGVVAWLYWDLVWPPPSGLVSIDGKTPRLRDQYYALKHYARFTDPGDVRVGATADVAKVRASAFVSPAGDRLTAIIINAGAEPADVRVDLGGFPAASSAVYRTVYRPGRSETWKELGGLPATRLVPLPGRSIATVVLRS